LKKRLFEQVDGLRKADNGCENRGVPDRKALLFRVDADPVIGMGHLMRCLSIADAARERGSSCVFLTGEQAAETVAARGFRAEVLRIVPPFVTAEIARIRQTLEETGAQAVIADSYAVTQEYLEALHAVCRGQGAALVYLDDIAAFAYPCDILINYNIFAPEWRENYEKLYGGALPQLLLGAEYAPLRAEFASEEERTIRENASDVLVSTGGADAEHMGLALVREILRRPAGQSNPTFHFVVGRMSRDAEQLRKTAEGSEKIRLHFDVTDMASLMRSCDAAISASGSTLCELCATRTPALTYILADNQIAVAEGFSKRGVMRCCGDIRELGAEKLAATLIDEVFALCADVDMRRNIALRMHDITDARGAARIAAYILRRSVRCILGKHRHQYRNTE